MKNSALKTYYLKSTREIFRKETHLRNLIVQIGISQAGKSIMQYRSVASIIRPLRIFQGTQYIAVRQDESLIQFFILEVLETNCVFMNFCPHMSNFVQPKIIHMN